MKRVGHRNMNTMCSQVQSVDLAEGESRIVVARGSERVSGALEEADSRRGASVRVLSPSFSSTGLYNRVWGSRKTLTEK